jgi:threonylcarbamoyladenosine tRNA methylthiotransferase MtaB
LLQQGVSLGKTDADIVVVNTCTVTDHVDKEAISLIKKIKKDHPKTIIVVTGCGVRVSKNPFSTLDEVNYIISDFSQRDNLRSLFFPVVSSGTQEIISKTRALIPIQQGCDNFCSFCIIPFVRGRSVSRREEDIIRDIRAKEEEGYQEIVITGINMGAYGASTSTRFQESQFATLLQHILQ